MRRAAWIWFLLFAAQAARADFVSIGEQPAVLYDAPSPKAKKILVVSEHYPLEVVVRLEKWVKVRDNTGQLAWVDKSMLSGSRYVMVSAQLADIRDAADAKGQLVFQAKSGVLLEVIEIAAGGWIKVRHQDGQSGFVKSTQVWGG